MTRRIRLLAAAPLAAAALALGGCVVTPDVVEPPAPCSAVAVHPLAQCSQAYVLEVESVVVSQQQAVPDFDGTRYLVEDADELDRLEAILNPTHPIATGEPCAGGRTTVLEITPVAGVPFVLETDTCGDDGTATQLDELASEWRESGAFPVAP